jgi:hypothetical protein
METKRPMKCPDYILKKLTGIDFEK